MPDEATEESKAQELAAAVREIQERVRSHYATATGSETPVPQPDLMAVLHARDAAEAKVASIGIVNPRPPGFFNSLIQGVKKTVARALDWHVREQVEFNRASVECVNATLDALNDLNRAMMRLNRGLKRAEEEARELADIRVHWVQWRQEWERKLASTEMQFLRSVAELEASFRQRTMQIESASGELAASQHRDFSVRLDQVASELNAGLLREFDRLRTEHLVRMHADYERIIHSELRLIRQRMATGRSEETASPPVPGNAAPPIDWLKFADRFRGTEEYVKDTQRFYLPHFSRCHYVLDVGCGRGEFLELMQESGVAARGIDLNEECVTICRQKGLEAQLADVFTYLHELPAGGFDGIFCGQVVEHIAPERLPDLIRLMARALQPGGVLVVETPNPESLAIFATHFYIDPTHVRPVPAALLVFYMEEYGLGGIRVERRFPAVESLPALAQLPEEVRDSFFGGLDYAAIATKLT